MMSLASVAEMTTGLIAGAGPGLTGQESSGGGSGGSSGVLVGIVSIAIIVALAGYVVSLFLHPWRNCRSCRGAGRKRGSIYTYTQRPCERCQGSGRRVRFGNRFRDVSVN